MPRPPPLTPPPQGCFYFAVERQCFETRQSAKRDYKCTLARVSRGNKDAARQSFCTSFFHFKPDFLDCNALYDPNRPSVKSEWGDERFVDCALQKLFTNITVTKCFCVIWLSLLRWETLWEVLVQSATRLPWGHLHLTYIPDLLGDIIIKMKTRITLSSSWPHLPMRRSRFIRWRCFYELSETESIFVNYPQWH